MLIIIWEILSRQGVFPAYQFPAPSIILETIIIWFKMEVYGRMLELLFFEFSLDLLSDNLLAVILGSFVGFIKKQSNYLIR